MKLVWIFESWERLSYTGHLTHCSQAFVNFHNFALITECYAITALGSGIYVFAVFITYVSTMFFSMLNLTATYNLKFLPCRNS